MKVERLTFTIDVRPRSLSRLVLLHVQLTKTAWSRNSRLKSPNSVLKAAEVGLAAAYSHVQQFQETSQVGEAAFQSPSATHGEYKASNEAQIAKVEAEWKAPDEEVSSLQDKITRLATKSDETQQSHKKACESSFDGDDVNGHGEEMRCAVAYLRKEKRIVDLRPELLIARDYTAKDMNRSFQRVS